MRSVESLYFSGSIFDLFHNDLFVNDRLQFLFAVPTDLFHTQSNYQQPLVSQTIKAYWTGFGSSTRVPKQYFVAFAPSTSIHIASISVF